MYVTYTRIYGWSDYGGESSYQPGYRLENMMWMTLLVYDYIIPGEMIMEKMMNTKTEGNTFTKKIGQTVYVVRYHFNENAKETMQEKINRMLVTEASRQAVY